MPVQFASADDATLHGREWISAQWDAARLMAGGKGAVLVLDEVQKVEGWSETVKRLWDEDSRHRRDLKVVVLGSAQILVQKGLADSLTGRFEVLHLPHWSLSEMHSAFGWRAEEFIFHGGYPGAAALVSEEDRWVRYVRDALIETTISRDILQFTRIDKPALLRRVFELGCRYSGQILSYTKMVGQLQDAGNTTTLAHYLDVLAAAGMVRGLQKYAGAAVRQRASSPKLQVMNTALISAQAGYTFEEARKDREYWGRLVESAVGAHLANAAAAGVCELFYWRDSNREVDFVVRAGRRLIIIEVKSGRMREMESGISSFSSAFTPHRILLVGADGIPVTEFLNHPVSHWIQP
jgi:predicted AAA+ superfamily ATPase